MTITRIALASLFVFLLFAERLYGQDALSSARDLYASAEYDEALKVLDRLSTDASSNEHRHSIELYRALCLLAVGRRDDADRAIEMIIARDPLYRPGDDVSPRTRTAFSDVKKRVLPAILQQKYSEAKGTFDRKEFEAAAAAFKRVIDALNDPDIGLAAQQPPLSDLRTLAAGFHDLSLKAIPPPPPPPPPPAPAPPVDLTPKVYTADDSNVRPPTTIEQALPRYPGVVPPGGFMGIIEVVITEKGSVESASMVVPLKGSAESNGKPIPLLHSYDKTVMTAASRWQFSPATMNGMPVKFRKRIQINISPATP